MVLLRRVFPVLDNTVRIDPNNLPGLRPPTVAPFRPVRSKPDAQPEPDYRAMYKKFKGSGSERRVSKEKKDFES